MVVVAAAWEVAPPLELVAAVHGGAPLELAQGVGAVAAGRVLEERVVV